MKETWPLDGSTGSPAFEPGFQTDWLAVRAAGQSTPEAAGALEKLCRTYWYPLYAYVRRRGHDPHEAQDLTQEFFARLLASPWLQDVHPSKGRFRAFLLASMNHFLANKWRREQAQKRGGGRAVFSLDAVEAEERYRFEPIHDQSPDKVFEHGWAIALLNSVKTRLREEYAASGKRGLFEELKGVLDGEKNQRSHAETATRLGMSEAAVKKTAQRLRERYLALLRAEVAQTVKDPGEVDEEIRCLFAALLQ
jgi:RNA polymerase sigma factor (sigma-70 family)